MSLEPELIVSVTPSSTSMSPTIIEFLFAATERSAEIVVSEAVSPRMVAEVEMSLSSMAPAIMCVEVIALAAMPLPLTCVKGIIN